LESWWNGNVVGSSGIYKCCRARCWEEFALSTLTIGWPIDVAPNPGLARPDRALEDILSSSSDGLIEIVSLLFELMRRDFSSAKGPNNLLNRRCYQLGHSQEQLNLELWGRLQRSTKCQHS
jgi:hypothetical protein